MHDRLKSSPAVLDHPCDTFPRRHIGPDASEEKAMLDSLGLPSLEALIVEAVPADIRLQRPLNLPEAAGERAALDELAALSQLNTVARCHLGTGYHGCITPPVIQRNILENPGWYTAYTPYQAEIAQGRLEALINFQTMITDLTGMDISNASLLDESTAAAEAVALAFAVRKNKSARTVVIASDCHPQNFAVVETRAEPLGIAVVSQPPADLEFDASVFAVVLQYPGTDGVVRDFAGVVEKAHAAGALVIVASDLLALTLLRPPGEWGADMVVGSAQRFGMPMGHGGPHAAFFATRDALKRHMPGRLVGVSHDVDGRPAFRLSLQTREQHIRREKATSNICTAQVLPAVIASMYAVYHGPEGLKAIARRVHRQAKRLATSVAAAGFETSAQPFFDTVRVTIPNQEAAAFAAKAEAQGLLLRVLAPDTLTISLDETTDDLTDLLALFRALPVESTDDVLGAHARTSSFLTHPVFQTHHTETEMLRYIRRLESKDLSLTTSMIPLGSCTMKLNATSQMFPVTWPQWAGLHPHCPASHSRGFATLFEQLEEWLAEITGFHAVSLQPNAGSQGELAGLLAIRAWHRSRGEGHRNICLIPTSAHGTNPASAVMAGFVVVGVKCLENGDIDVADLRAKAGQHAQDLAALMVTYPSTHGVFESTIRQITGIIHDCGGQVYMDGANLNAQVGLASPAMIGADVCHLNLHKTFCIPHGGGGPGVGPIGVAAHLTPFIPATSGIGMISAAPRGSALVDVIPWMYIRTMGAEGLTRATSIAVLNANYMAERLQPYFPVLFRGEKGRVAHECIIDLRHFKIVTAEDVAKRLMDYGFHAPTLSWPVGNTLMIEPTESESKAEMDRFCDAMISIHSEVMAVENGAMDAKDNPLKNAPHPADRVCGDTWTSPYGRELAAYPLPYLRQHKFWPSIGRIDNVHGDRNLFCTCPPVEA